MKQNQRNTRARIIASAWRLFYEQGYYKTTVEEIIADSQTSKGSFYHYFEGKDALLSSLSEVFDQKYAELEKAVPADQNAFDTLMMLNRELFSMIENSISIDLLSRLYSTQLVTAGDKHLLDHSRVYYKLLRKIVIQGQERGEIRAELSCGEIVKAYALCERALLYDWCLLGGEYSLRAYGSRMMPRFLGYLLPEQKQYNPSIPSAEETYS